MTTEETWPPNIVNRPPIIYSQDSNGEFCPPFLLLFYFGGGGLAPLAPRLCQCLFLNMGSVIGYCKILILLQHLTSHLLRVLVGLVPFILFKSWLLVYSTPLFFKKKFLFSKLHRNTLNK